MCTVEKKPGNQEEFPNVFQRAACDRVGEDQHMKYQQYDFGDSLTFGRNERELEKEPWGGGADIFPS